jgi:hypothetical protein
MSVNKTKQHKMSIEINYDEITDEIFKEVKEGIYEHYAVSNYGRVVNMNTGRVLKPSENKDEYLRVCFCKNLKKTNLKN